MERTTDGLRLLPTKQQFQEIDPLLKFHWFQMEAPEPGSTGKQRTGQVHYRNSDAAAQRLLRRQKAAAGRRQLTQQDRLDF